MKRKKPEPTPPKKKPKKVQRGTPCSVCRDGTTATTSLMMFEDWETWSPFCEPCGTAMASVIRDSQGGRVAELRPLPPVEYSEPEPEVPEPEPEPVVIEVKPEPKPKPAPPKESSGGFGIDLMSILGLK